MTPQVPTQGPDYARTFKVSGVTERVYLGPSEAAIYMVRIAVMSGDYVRVQNYEAASLATSDGVISKSGVGATVDLRQWGVDYAVKSGAGPDIVTFHGRTGVGVSVYRPATLSEAIVAVQVWYHK